MTAKFLHREIREKGGAYGGGARLGGGLFSFYSYRWVGALLPEYIGQHELRKFFCQSNVAMFNKSV